MENELRMKYVEECKGNNLEIVFVDREEMEEKFLLLFFQGQKLNIICVSYKDRRIE